MQLLQFVLEMDDSNVLLAYNIPPSLSILINFGIDEDDFYYYVENWKQPHTPCPPDHIYDTHAEKCRKVKKMFYFIENFVSNNVCDRKSLLA